MMRASGSRELAQATEKAVVLLARADRDAQLMGEPATALMKTASEHPACLQTLEQLDGRALTAEPEEIGLAGRDGDAGQRAQRGAQPLAFRDHVGHDAANLRPEFGD